MTNIEPRKNRNARPANYNFWFGVAANLGSTNPEQTSLKQVGDVMSGAEIIPDLSVIVHERIVKGGLLWVKEIVGGYVGLKVFLDMGLVD